MDLPVLDNSYEFDYIICSLLWMVSFTSHSVLKGHSCCSAYQYYAFSYNQIIFHCMSTYLLFILSSVDIHLYDFCFLTIRNNVALDICVHTTFVYILYLWTYYIFNSLGFLSRIEIFELYGNSVWLFRNFQIGFKHAPLISIPTSDFECFNSPHPHQHLLLPISFILAIPVHVKWYHIVALISISLVTTCVEHFFLYAYWPFIYFLWRNIYLNILLILIG